MSFVFERPEYLWALLLALPMVLFAWQTRRALSRRRMGFALAVRLGLLACIVFALAGLTRLAPADALGVVFVVDRSASVGASGEAQAVQFIQEALENQGPDDYAGLVVFGGDAVVEREPGEKLRVDGLESVPLRHQSDLSAGLRLGTALLPADRTQRVVLLTDGEQTRGDAASQVLLSADGSMQVDVVEIGRDTGPEVLLEDLLTPARVDEGEAFEVKVVARSEVDTSGTVRLFRNDTYMGELPMELQAGRAAVVAVRQEADEPGLIRYRAVFQPDDPSQDGLAQNNQVVGSVQVTGRPRLLLAQTDIADAQPLKAALEGEGFVVDVLPPERMPAGLADLRPYSAVFLADVPSYAMTRRQQEALRSYVRDLGRGLVMLGSDKSFGLGGYYKSPVEDALPVRMDITDKTRFPKLGMILAVDKSCSMGGGQGSKLELAKEAGIQTAELLSERDLLGVIGFDGAASWIVPFNNLEDRQRVIDDISALRTGGGTDIYPALDTSIQTLNNSDASLKHIILLSDGMTAGGDFQTLITDAHKQDITLTTVGIGSDTDRTTMDDFARWGGGNSYLVTDPSSIPAIFTRETLLASRSFLIEEPFRPQVNTPSELIRGIERWPTFRGHVAVEAKKRATVSLVVPDGEQDLPLLAQWRYGLGRSVAFTSDANTRWSGRWVSTEEYARFWAQVGRWVASGNQSSDLQTTAEIREGQLVVSVDAFDTAGSFRNFLEGEARVVAPDLTVKTLELKQVAPGRYEAVLPVDQDGSWMVGVALSDKGEVVGQSVAEAVQPYSPEYRSKGAGKGLMEELARLGGGSVLTDPAQAFARPDTPREIPHPWWPWLMGLAAALLIADVALRRLDLRRSSGEVVVARPAPAMPRFKWQPKPGARKQRAEAEVAEPVQEDAHTAPPEVQVDPNSYAGRLLKARQAARDKLDQDGGS